MKKKVSEQVKLDQALISQALSSTSATGKYFPLFYFGRALFLLVAGAIAAGKTAKVEVYEAQDAEGTGAKKITSAEATIVANTGVIEATVTLTTPTNGDVVVVNGIAFVKAAATDVAAKEFADAAGLVANIVEWLPEFKSSDAGTVVTIGAAEPGDEVVTVSTDSATIVIATTEAIAYVEISTGALDKKNGFTHVAAKVTTDASIQVAAQILRGSERYSPEQKVAAKISVPVI